MKKIDLHCHLDGSLDPSYIEKLLGPGITSQIISRRGDNLAAYLEKFQLPISLLQTYKNLSNFACLLAKSLVLDEVIYAEIRFCPLLHLQRGLTPKEVVSAVLSGLQQITSVKTNLILCMMRNLSFADNVTIIDLAKSFRNQGVVALDLAGDEAAHPNSSPEFMELFQRASAAGIPFTIHAGEADGPNGVNAAIKLGAQRIGHGVRAIESKDTIQHLITKHIPLEVCLTSNIDTGIYSNLIDHPIRELFEAGVIITLNTDNRTISSTTLTKEYNLLQKYFGFNRHDFLLCNLFAVTHSFADNALKVQLSRELLNNYHESHRRFD